MALNKTGLIAALKEIKNLPNDNGQNNTDLALEKLADAIEAFVKSGAVTGTVTGNNTIISAKVT